MLPPDEINIMDHATASINLLDCPNETLMNICQYLPREDVVRARQCCHRLALVAAPALFNTISTSFDSLHQLLLLAYSHLAPFVERLIFNERCYSLQSATRDAWNWAGLRYSDDSPLRDAICQHAGIYRASATGAVWNDPLSDSEMKEAGIVPFRFPREICKEFLDQIISSIHAVYRNRADFQSSETAFVRLYWALQRLTSLKVISIRSARANGMISSLPACEELRQLNDHFPVSEGSYYMMHAESHNPPHKGFSMLLKVLSVLKRKVEMDVMHTGGLMSMGVDLLDSQDDQELHFSNYYSGVGKEDKSLSNLEINTVKGFEYLKKLDLRVSTALRPDSDKVARSILKNGLEHAAILEELTLAADTQGSSIDHLMPTLFKAPTGRMTRYFHLKAVSLQGFKLTLPPSLADIIRYQMPLLRRLTFVECHLEDKKWKDVLQELSDDQNFTLDGFVLDRCTCKEDDEKTELAIRLLILPWPHDMVGMVPARVSGPELTQFINSPGSPNPLAIRGWRLADTDAHMTVHWTQKLAEAGINYSHNDDFDDMSDWEADDPSDEENSGRAFEDEDTEGPEFNSDYDFSAEEESSDEEMDVDVERYYSAGTLLDRPTRIHVQRNKVERGILPPFSKRSVEVDDEDVETTGTTAGRANANQEDARSSIMDPIPIDED